MENDKAEIYISRLRVGTDGKGVRTMVSFTGCSIRCRFCLNTELLRSHSDGKKYTPEELYRELSRDKWYFLSTGGGITFSGGEPLLHSSFIEEFCRINSLQEEPWDIAIETSLNVPNENLEEVLPYINTYIVDIKDANPEIYTKYTMGGSISPVLDNLDHLRDMMINGYDYNVIVRVPLIWKFNTYEDSNKSIAFINERYNGLFSIDQFEYILAKEGIPETDGKRICKVLKSIRKQLIQQNDLDISQHECHYEGNCPGTCPRCEAELEEINKSVIRHYANTLNKIGELKNELEYKPSLTKRRSDPSLGIPLPYDKPLMGAFYRPEKNIDDDWDF